MAAPVQDVFMLFGDSLTQGAWAPGEDGIGQRLSHVYARKLDVLNRGFSGYNTEWALPVLGKCIAQASETSAPRIRVITLWFGANDACIKPSPQHVPLDAFQANIRKMIDIIQSRSPDTKILLITAPPVNTHQRRADLESRTPPMELDRLFDTSKAYADAVRVIGEELGLGVVDAWSALWKACGEDEAAFAQFSPDGLHLKGRGYAVLYEEMMKVIADRYPEVQHDNLGFVFPPWKDIDWEHPERSLGKVERL